MASVTPGSGNARGSGFAPNRLTFHYAELLRKRKRECEAKQIEERIQAVVAASPRASLGQTVDLRDLRR